VFPKQKEAHHPLGCDAQFPISGNLRISRYDRSRWLTAQSAGVMPLCTASLRDRYAYRCCVHHSTPLTAGLQANSLLGAGFLSLHSCTERLTGASDKDGASPRSRNTAPGKENTCWLSAALTLHNITWHDNRFYIL